MARVEINYFTGVKNEEGHLTLGDAIMAPEIIEGPDSIKDGYKRFMQLIETKSPWLLHASVKHDLENNMNINITLRIGPEAIWSKDYIKEHGVPEVVQRYMA